MREEDTFLFDRLARPGFGDIPGAIAAGEHPEVEINRRRMKAIGITELGSSFGVDGNVIVCEANFLRLFPQRHAGIIDLGLIRLQPGIDPESVRPGLQQVIGSEAQVLTRDDFESWRFSTGKRPHRLASFSVLVLWWDFLLDSSWSIRFSTPM